MNEAQRAKVQADRCASSALACAAANSINAEGRSALRMLQELPTQADGATIGHKGYPRVPANTWSASVSPLASPATRWDVMLLALAGTLEAAEPLRSGPCVRHLRSDDGLANTNQRQQRTSSTCAPLGQAAAQLPVG